MLSFGDAADVMAAVSDHGVTFQVTPPGVAQPNPTGAATGVQQQIPPSWNFNHYAPQQQTPAYAPSVIHNVINNNSQNSTQQNAWDSGPSIFFTGTHSPPSYRGGYYQPETPWERDRRKEEEQRRAREIERRDLNDPRPPRSNEIRSLATENIRPNMSPLLSFIWAQSTQSNGTLSRTTFEFWDRLDACESEQESRNYIYAVYREIQFMKDHSVLSPEYQRRFDEKLNYHVEVNDMRGVAVALGAALCVFTGTIFLNLVTAQASVLTCAAAAMFCMVSTFGPYYLADKSRSETRSFPRDCLATRDIGSFTNWVEGLNEAVEEALRNPRASFARPVVTHL